MTINTGSGLRKFEVTRDEVKLSTGRIVVLFHLKGKKGAQYTMHPYRDTPELYYCLKVTGRLANPFPSRSWKLDEDGTLKEVLL